MKVNARNNIIRKLANSKWGCKASTLRPSCLTLCYSAAEYACPVWARSTHAHKLNPALHDCCRIISCCLKPTNLDSVHLLAGIAPPHIRMTVACRMERTWQTPDASHQLFHHNQLLADWSRGRASCAQSRRSTRLQAAADGGSWKPPASVKIGLEVAESLPAGSGEDWLCWRALNRLRTGVGRAKTVMWRWGLSRRRSVGGMRLRGATDDGPSPLLPSTRRGLHCWRPGHSDRAAGTRHAPASGKQLCEGHERRRRTWLFRSGGNCHGWSDNDDRASTNPYRLESRGSTTECRMNNSWQETTTKSSLFF